jgi:CheY-like chemotaxis protein
MARVLIVDDDEGIRETVRFLLEDAGHEVVEARDGATGLDILRTSADPLVVLLDYRMPRMDGGEVLRVAAEGGLATRHAFAMMLASPYLLNRDSSGQVQVGSFHIPVVAKPFDIDSLLGLVERLATHLELA